MIDLGLMMGAGTAPDERGGTRQVQLYCYTLDGQLLACIIKSLDPTKREEADSEAYDIIQSILNTEPRRYYEIFYSVLFKKYKDKGVFGEFIMDPLRQSLDSNSQTKTMEELHTSLKVFHTSNVEKAKLYLDLWDEAFDEMSPSVQELLLFHMKSQIEQKMTDRAKDPQKYEEYRLKFNHFPTMLTMEGYCEKCNYTYPSLMNVRDYHERTNFLPNDPILHNCPNCKNMSLLVPTI